MSIFQRLFKSSEMSRVFISYRRADSTELAQSLAATLKSYIPEAAVFLDLERIDIGEDFSNVIFNHIKNCEVVILLISEDWIHAIKNPSSEETNWIRMEVETALRLQKRIIPVITQPGSPFYEMELPKSIEDVRKRNCFELPAPEPKKLELIGAKVKEQLDQMLNERIEKLGRNIAKPSAAIRHVWDSIKHAVDQGIEDPGPEDIWEALLHLAQEKHGEKRWKRVLTNYKLRSSEDLGLIVFACIVEGFFVISDIDEPSDYWGLGSIDDL